MSCESRIMGNCNSKRQESAECCETNEPHPPSHHQPDTSSSNSTNTQDNAVIQEQVTSQSVRSNLATSPTEKSLAPDKSDGGQRQQQQSAGDNRLQTENDAVIDLTRAQVNSLLDGIHQFQGTSTNDKDYRYLDEMLTRCILKLDTIECNDSQDRANRKEAIRGVNEAISILERKLEINNEIKMLESDLKTE